MKSSSKSKLKSKLFIVFALLLCVSSANAQNVAKGKWLAGGSLTYQQGSEFKFGDQEISLGGPGKLNTFGFTPRIGYFFTDNIAAGARLAFATAGQGSNLVKARATAFAIAPFARYYHKLNDKLFVFGEAAFNIGSISLTVDNPPLNTKDSFSLFQVGINPGLAYFLHEKISLELMVNFLTYSSFKPKDGKADNNVSVGPSFEGIPTVAILFYF